MGSKLLAGLQLMVFGMGMVYVFLVIMIYCMKLMSKIIAPFAAKQAAAEQAKRAQTAAAKAGNGDDPALIAAAVAAVAAARR